MESTGIQADPNGQTAVKGNGIFVYFSVGPGATLSLLNFEMPQDSNETVVVHGVTGKKELSLSLPLPVILEEQLVRGQTVLSPESPVSLRGRDLLQELGTCISPTPQGIRSTIIGSQLVAIDSKNPEDLQIPEELKESPPKLRSTSGDETGVLKSAEPLVIKTKRGSPPSTRQQPIVAEAIPRIGKQIKKFLEQGTLKECRSPYNSPSLPVSKHRKDKDGDPE